MWGRRLTLPCSVFYIAHDQQQRPSLEQLQPVAGGHRMGSTKSVALKYLGALTAAGAIAAAASMAWATAPVAAASQFVVGFANPITGAEATYGVSDQHAVEMAAAQINKAGGVLGRSEERRVGKEC